MLKILKMLVKIPNFVGSCYLLCMLAIDVLTVSSCVWYVMVWRSGQEHHNNTKKVLLISPHQYVPNTAGYSEHIYCQHTQ